MFNWSIIKWLDSEIRTIQTILVTDKSDTSMWLIFACFLIWHMIDVPNTRDIPCPICSQNRGIYDNIFVKTLIFRNSEINRYINNRYINLYIIQFEW
jgi:hypothetical protein